MRGVVKSLVDASGMLTDAAGRLTQLVRGSVTTGYDYYDWNEKINNIGQGGRLESLVSTDLQDLSYTYDQAGNITSILDDVASESLSFSYDALNQIIGTTGAYTQTYGYDSGTGNLIDMDGTSYTYNAQVSCDGGNRTLSHAVSQAGTNTYSYDCNGNMLGRCVARSQRLIFH